MSGSTLHALRRFERHVVIPLASDPCAAWDMQDVVAPVIAGVKGLGCHQVWSLNTPRVCPTSLSWLQKLAGETAWNTGLVPKAVPPTK